MATWLRFLGLLIKSDGILRANLASGIEGKGSKREGAFRQRNTFCFGEYL